MTTTDLEAQLTSLAGGLADLSARFAALCSALASAPPEPTVEIQGAAPPAHAKPMPPVNFRCRRCIFASTCDRSREMTLTTCAIQPKVIPFPRAGQ